MASAKYFLFACWLYMFWTYWYHHHNIHMWALRIHTKYLSIIHKISWITHKGSSYDVYILKKIPGIRGRFIPHIWMPEIINYKRVLSHSILISTYTQIISEPIVQNIFYLQHIANSLSNAFTNQKCHQIIFLQVMC